MWRNWNTHTLLVGMANGKSLAVSQMVKRRAIWPSNSIPRYIPKRNENIRPHKNLYVNVHSSTIHNSQKVKTTQVSINWWIDKQNMEYPYNGTLFRYRKEWSTDTCYNMNELWKHYAKWKKPVTKDHIFYNSIQMKCPEETNIEWKKVG